MVDTKDAALTLLGSLIIYLVFYYVYYKPVMEPFVRRRTSYMTDNNKSDQLKDPSDISSILGADDIKSHENYVSSSSKYQLGPSRDSDRSDSNEIVPRMGLRAHTSQMVPVSSSARVTPSEYPHQTSAYYFGY